MVVGLEAGILFETCAEGLKLFKGVDRRFQKKGEASGIEVYDDYGHHPTEVRAVISAFKEKFPTRRLMVAFQPHRYTRTQTCWSEFLSCFEGADQIFITDIYGASERPIPGITAQRLASEVKITKCEYVSSGEKALTYILPNLKNGDIFLTLGAGDIWEVGSKILDRLKD